MTRSRSRSDERRHARRKVIITICFVLLLCVSSLFWGPVAARELSRTLVAHSSHFRVKQVYVVGNHRLSVPTILELAGIHKGDALFNVSCAQAATRVKRHSWIRRVEIRRHLPEAIEIHVWEREPVAALRGSTMMVLTADSVAVAPFGQNWSWDLPILTPQHPLEVGEGQRLSDPSAVALLGETLKLRRVSAGAWSNLSEIYSGNTGMLAVFSKPRVEVLLGRGVGELEWSAALQLIRDHEQQGDALCRRLDLRVPGKVILSYQSFTALEPVHG